MNNGLLTKSQVAKLLGVSTRTIDRYRADGCKLGCIKLGRTTRFQRSAIETLASKGFKVRKTK
jgi:excisionase family DNA binding protein